MRILYCSVTYPPDLNGEAIFTKNLAEGIAKQGDQVMVLVPGKLPSSTRESINGLQLVYVPVINIPVILKDLRLAIAPARYIHRIFEEFQPAVVHIQDPSPLCQAVRWEACQRNIPIIMTHHTGPEVTAPHLRLNNSSLKKFVTWVVWKFLIRHLAQANIVTVPSKYSAQMLRERGLRAEIQVVPCGVWTDFHPDRSLDRKAVRQRYGLDPLKTLLLYVGRLDFEKNLDTFLKAMAIADQPNLEFAIAGQGLQEAYLRQLAMRLGLGQRVHFLGQVNPSVLSDLLNSADIFVMPGNGESFSLATLEAMACGKPILAANAAALPELVTHMVNGYLFEPLQIEEAAEGIQTLATRADQWPMMGLSSEAKAKKYSLDRFIQNYKQIYDTSLKRNHDLPTVMNSEKRLSRQKLFTGRNKSRWFGPGFLRILILILSLFTSTFLYDEAQAISDLRVTDLAPLKLKHGTRLLVISPHPDDEMLAAGGVMQRVLVTGGQVEVVLVTNGDGQIFSPFVVNNRIEPKPSDYVNVGTRRQIETLNALKEIGIGADKVTFLGFPDGRLNEMWRSNWQQTHPIRAPYTHAIKSPYTNTFGQQAAYGGLQLSQDLKDILQRYQPDVILFPHPEDTNSDHAAVSNFAQFAIASYLASHHHQAPMILTYLVHYEAYPIPRSEDTKKVLLPPTALANGGVGWVTLSLTNQERDNKKDALRAYTSQQRITPIYLDSFARANEIFFKLPILELPSTPKGDRSALETDLRTEAALFEPEGERFDRLVLKSADLIGWKAARLGDLVCFAAATRGPIDDDVNYQIIARLPSGEILKVSQKDQLRTFTDHLFGACFSLNSLGNPSTIGFSAETRSGIPLDRTAWHFVYFSNSN